MGHDLLHVPAVSVVTFDDRDRVLLVRSIDAKKWTTPGGMVEPGETPADAAVREMYEETGLYVELTRIIGVFGGRLFADTYSNGDEISWVLTGFEARPLTGQPAPDGQETFELGYFTSAEAHELDSYPEMAEILDVAFACSPVAYFSRPMWEPSEKAAPSSRPSRR